LARPHSPQCRCGRDFYARVVGWKPEDVEMGGYSDYNMNSPVTGETMAGVCWKRGPNAKLPAQWLIYITVADAEESARECERLGGKVLDGPRSMGESKFAVIQDPAGAVCAVISY